MRHITLGRGLFRAGRTVKRASAACAACALVTGSAPAQVPGGSLDPTTIPKFVAPLRIPGVMPVKALIPNSGGSPPVIPSYEIEVTQFAQQVLPAKNAAGRSTGLPATQVWGYAAVGHPETRTYPAQTIENLRNVPARIKWVNNLKDSSGHFLPHLLPVDQSLHWANPGQLECREGGQHTDCKPLSPPQTAYKGPVPIVTHVHGAHVGSESDGFPNAWFLPNASNIPAGFASRGSLYGQIAGVALEPGAAVYQYPNDQVSTTLWYHDHTLGMTHANMYAGPVGFYLVRDLADVQLHLPGPPPVPGLDPNGNAKVRSVLREIPLVIHDRSFNADGSLFYPATRDFFEGLPAGTLEELGVRFTPEGGSDMAKIWQPEFFGNTLVVNGQTWPKFEVRKQRYRFRILNGSGSRFLLLRFENESIPFAQIGGDQGFLPAPVTRSRLLLGPAERADVIVDFSGVPAGTRVVLQNVAPDEPFGGGEPCLAPGSVPGAGCDFMPADPNTTGVVMAFDVLAAQGRDPSVVPASLPTPPLNLTPTRTRKLTLNEGVSNTERVCVDPSEQLVVVPGTANDEAACNAAGGSLEPFGPRVALLGNLDASSMSQPQHWDAPITENPALNSTETWEIYNFTEDAHPIHLHLVRFRVLERQALATGPDGMAMQPAEVVPGTARGPDAGESGFKDTVIAYPGEVTRIAARFDKAGLYVWHCHILEHEDNEMMRPYCVGGASTCPLPIGAQP
jgi:FtsP/CotA-like multicopper oxidase with cupredoxin domain